MSGSPQMSATLVDGPERHGDAAAQPLSKREKRRNYVSDKLRETTNDFNANRDQHYRQQLQAVQIDTALILQADLYEDSPLEDGGDAIVDLIEKVIVDQGHAMIRSPNGEISNQAGKFYADFVREINDAKEERDATLTTQKLEYDRKVAGVKATRMFKAKTAEEEFRSLAGSLRDRVINSVTAKKARLNRDKEGLDITDSNALLLHPSHYASTIPGSPGGIHGKRSTRHRRDADELPMFGDNKRKRNMDDDDSPAPSRRAFDNGSGTPLWHLESTRATSKQVDRPLYSIDKLFTDKELYLTYQTAAYAARNYILSHGHENSSSSDGRGSPSDDEVEEDDEPEGAPAMERNYSHATRSTRNAGNFNTPHGIEALIDFSNGNLSRVAANMPKLPPFIQSNNLQKIYTRETSIVHMPVVLDETNADIASIKKCKRLNEEAGMQGRNLTDGSAWRAQLEAAAAPPGQYLAWVQTRDRPRDAAAPAAAAPLPSSLRTTADDALLGGVPMSKTSSMGFSDGGVSMSRAGSGSGMGRGRRRGGA